MDGKFNNFKKKYFKKPKCEKNGGKKFRIPKIGWKKLQDIFQNKAMAQKKQTMRKISQIKRNEEKNFRIKKKWLKK